jgi:hypothetical protein
MEGTGGTVKQALTFPLPYRPAKGGGNQNERLRMEMGLTHEISTTLSHK